MIDLRELFIKLDSQLIALLESLEKEDWNKQTVAKHWKVKDVVAHLLDGNMRILSGLRDDHPIPGPEINSYKDLVTHINALNAEWVKAMKRISPEVLISLLKFTSEPIYEYYTSLELFAKAKYAVAWAGETESTNWMHIARDYTEKFLHQQQIRAATKRPGIITSEYFIPFIDVCMYAMPHTLKNIKPLNGSSLKVKITGDVQAMWLFEYNGGKWQKIDSNFEYNVVSTVSIDAHDAWKLFSKSLRPHELLDKIDIIGNKEIGEQAIEMVSFMS